MSSSTDRDALEPLQGKRVAFLGKLGGVTKREAQQLVRERGGLPVEAASGRPDVIVIGADELPLDEQGELLDEATKAAAAGGEIEILRETQLWQQLGLVENEQYVRRLYTPAMLAELLGVSVRTVRRWHRRGLIKPTREVRRLPYFDFEEVAIARHLAQLVAAGASPAALEKKLAELARFVPGVERPLAQLAVIVEGQQLLLRQGEGLIEPGGQLRIDFAALENEDTSQPEGATGADERATLALTPDALSRETAAPADLLARAAEMEDEGDFASAVEWCRAALVVGGPRSDVCFQMAELLYRLGDVTAARERYYMAIELDEDYVEARANLGCVLLETGQPLLAIAAFEGALAYHDEYPDVHYHLARALDQVDRGEDAENHWRRFLSLAPDSPWAEEAQERLATGCQA